MTDPGVLERIATALETIAVALTNNPAPRTTRRPDGEHTQFEWEVPNWDDNAPTAPLPEPAPPQERCGFLIEQYTHPLDRVTPIYQISKSGAVAVLNAQEAAALAELGDEEFTATMAARLAEVLAQRHGETRASAAPADQPPADDAGPEDVDEDERREREWARTVGNGGDRDA